MFKFFDGLLHFTKRFFLHWLSSPKMRLTRKHYLTLPEEVFIKVGINKQKTSTVEKKPLLLLLL